MSAFTSPAPLLLGLGLAWLIGACEPGSPIKTGCREDLDCTGGRLCVDGVCGVASGQAGADAGGGRDDGSAAAAADARMPAPADCNDSSWDPVQLTTVDEVRALVVGRWTKCGGGEPVNLRSPFEIADDGNWYLLVRQSDGTLARSMAFGDHGTYEIMSPTVLVAGAQSNVAFSLAPFIMNFGPALYTVAR